MVITLPQAGPPEHTHQQDELFSFLEGTYRMELEEHLFVASQGAFARVPAGQRHAWRDIGGAAGKILLISIPGGMKGMFEEVIPLYLSPNVDRQALAFVTAKYGMIVTGPPLTE